MHYVDTNILVYAFSGGKHQTAARRLLEASHTRLGTAFLTIDEFIWVARKATDRPTALDLAQRILATDLEILPVTKAEGRRAMKILCEGLDPHDATHAAVALEHCDAILSDDPDFDKVGLRRIGVDG